MKVSEIIEKLSQLDPDALVFAENKGKTDFVIKSNSFPSNTNILDIEIKHPKVIHLIVDVEENDDYD